MAEIPPKWIENTFGKGEVARYDQLLLFQKCFQKELNCRHIKNQGLFWKGLTVLHKLVA